MATTQYCEFEWFFLDDISTALGIPFNQTQILFIKPFGKDSVLVDFRFMPEFDVDGGIDAGWLSARMADLESQVNNFDSALYRGNVTLRTDVTWGLTNNARSPRKNAPYMGYSFQKTSSSEYERCKATHRCSRGWENYNQSIAENTYTEQVSAEC